MSSDYVSPWESRYASQEMLRLFSPKTRHVIWHRLWLALAEAEKELGLKITEEQIQELKTHLDEIDYEKVERYEKELQHDVMAHIHAWGDLCPKAKSIIHLGATSCFVTDNGDLLQMRQGIDLLLEKLRTVMQELANFATAHQDLPCLGWTHFQPAQLVTVGKRAALWLQDLFWDYQELERRRNDICFLGVKGATGTQASFLTLFNGNVELVQQLDKLVADKMGFGKVQTVAGQTYSRKQDLFILQTLAGIAVSAHKMATDIRLWAHLQEVEEGFGNKQVGSSAMPHKRNPILSERICGLSRFLIALESNPAYTAATQWMERSLDDSANRRLTLSDAFLAADSLLILLQKVISNLVVNEKVIEKHVKEELPFLATEQILMHAVKKGGDRQTLHEKLRQHSHESLMKIKQEGADNDLLERIANDYTFQLSPEELQDCLDPKKHVGLASQQVETFLKELSIN